MDPTNSSTIYNLKGFIVGNGGTDWDYDNFPSIPITLLNYNIISPEIFHEVVDNNCNLYFNYIKPGNYSDFCKNAWYNLFI